MIRIHFIEDLSEDSAWELLESCKIARRIRHTNIARQYYTRVNAPVFKEDGSLYHTCYSAQEVLTQHPCGDRWLGDEESVRIVVKQLLLPIERLHANEIALRQVSYDNVAFD